MKKVLAALTVFALSTVANAQVTVAEPEFIGQVLALKSDTEGTLLDKESAQIKTKAAASLYIVGIGSTKSRFTLTGGKAKVRLPKAAQTRLIVKAVDNKTDPLQIINVIRFEAKAKQRRALTSKVNTFGGASSNALDRMDFNAKKYGESSYLVVLDNLEPGEYGVTVSNPNVQDEKNTLMIATFGID